MYIHSHCRLVKLVVDRSHTKARHSTDRKANLVITFIDRHEGRKVINIKICRLYSYRRCSDLGL
jgi:hypothetical protein